jgi:hypothetical protein
MEDVQVPERPGAEQRCINPLCSALRHGRAYDLHGCADDADDAEAGGR